MTILRCPTCQKEFDMAASKTLPFCSDRCRRVDLGRWLTERYSFPATRLEDEDAESLDPDADEGDS